MKSAESKKFADFPARWAAAESRLLSGRLPNVAGLPQNHSQRHFVAPDGQEINARSAVPGAFVVAGSQRRSNNYFFFLLFLVAFLATFFWPS